MNQKYHSIVFVGVPCAGKGTQAELLAEREPQHYFHFSSGEMFRYLLKKKDFSQELEEKIRGIEQGNFVNDETTIHCVAETLSRYVQENKYSPETQILILDGVPRNVPQVHYVEDIAQVKQVFNFVVPRGVLFQRLSQRKLKEQRVDDTPQKLMQRIAKYWQETAPLIEEYRRRNFLVVTIDGLGMVEEVYERIQRKIIII